MFTVNAHYPEKLPLSVQGMNENERFLAPGKNFRYRFVVVLQPITAFENILTNQNLPKTGFLSGVCGNRHKHYTRTGVY